MPVHLKIETGMHRLGLIEEELPGISRILAETPNVVVKSVFSHLAASDDPDQDQFTHGQIKHFKRCAGKICANLQPTPLLHIVNSQAIVRFPDAQFSMVRLGIGMYGIGMPEEVKLECVHTLKTHVSQIKLLQPGDTVGYGRKGIVDRLQKVAIVAIGYADGLIRKAGNGRYALIVNDRKAPIVGSICMDMTMIDVTNIPDVSVGSEVIVFGKDLPITDLAIAADTIPYEVFTNLSNRVKRIYTYD
jgi:alanine racemase